MKTLAIIQARMNSRRFPGKVLAELRGKPVLKHVIDRVRQAATVNETVVATCWPGGDVIHARCEEWGVRCRVFVGEDDVLQRFSAVAVEFQAELVVRVCGDNPWIVPEAIDELVWESILGHDYVSYELDGQPAITRPTGYFAEVVKVAALSQLNGDLPEDDPQREHVTQGIYTNPWAYYSRFLPAPKWYLQNRPPNTAIDTPEDLERVAEMMGDCCV